MSTWKAPKPSDRPSKPIRRPSEQIKCAAGATQTSNKPAAPAPSLDPKVLKTERLKASRNFDSDSDTEADQSKPDVYGQVLSKLQLQVTKQEKQAAAKRPQKARPFDSTQPGQREHSPGNFSNVKHHPSSHTSRVMLPKGKAGAASRQMALAPQVFSQLLAWTKIYHQQPNKISFL